MDDSTQNAPADTGARGENAKAIVPHPRHDTRTIDDLGRLTLPKHIRTALGVGPGARLDMETDGKTLILRRAEDTCSLCGSMPAEGTWETDAGHLLCRRCLADASSFYLRLVSEGGKTQ